MVRQWLPLTAQNAAAAAAAAAAWSVTHSRIARSRSLNSTPFVV